MGASVLRKFQEGAGAPSWFPARAPERSRIIFRRGAPQGGLSCPSGAIHLLYVAKNSSHGAACEKGPAPVGAGPFLRQSGVRGPSEPEGPQPSCRHAARGRGNLKGKQPKRRQWRSKRGCFEAAARLAAPNRGRESECRNGADEVPSLSAQLSHFSSSARSWSAKRARLLLSRPRERLMASMTICPTATSRS